MSHRTDTADRERVRRGHSTRIDSERADRNLDTMREGWTREEMTNAPRTLAERRERKQADAAALSEAARAADAGAVARLARALAREAVMPAALALPCREHDAEAGAYCWRVPRGVCADRLERSRHA